ncbi:UDP-N-acetylglucosamine 2-epimerase [Flavobacterium restrictum]|uniref:UDP-N-acetylglucosamine 2-epimerase n=1 Tax=Flavobacterium restrictum TaxID=2594428 RepID=UPI00163D9D07
MSKPKKILFLTGTRADFGKIKSLIAILEEEQSFLVHVFVTGMHLLHEYGYTLIEIERCNYKNVHTFENHTHESTMDLTLAKTIEGLSQYVKECELDMIVIHGDRVEALAGAIVGSLNNILVAHIEGGEVSGTIDELIRHATSKMSHVHFVANEAAKNRLIQMGELATAVFTIGSPDFDSMLATNLPALNKVKEYYEIEFEKYAIVMFHPVTTEALFMEKYSTDFVNALLYDDHNYIVIFPNNDLGSKTIIAAYEKLKSNSRFRIFPSLRFEYFLTLLKNAQFIIGNSSAGIREAPHYGIPVINIGTRQHNRSSNTAILNVNYSKKSIISVLSTIDLYQALHSNEDYGSGNSAQLFLQTLKASSIWKLNHQKQFRDI